MLWTWLELVPFGAFTAWLIAVPAIAYFQRDRVVWNGDTVVDGRRVQTHSLAAVLPRVELIVDSTLSRGDLRARRKKAHDDEAKLDELARVLDVAHGPTQKGVTTLRIVVAPRPGSTWSVEKVVRATAAFVVALETSAGDGEGGPGGAPVAVPAA